MQRLDKILSEAGVASRRELKGIIKAGRIRVSGQIVTAPEEKFDEQTAEITLDGAPVSTRKTVVFLLHKPRGYVTSTDERGEHTVMELIPEALRKQGAMPVGRLDKDTEGLLLFTNDGQLAHRLIAPKSAVIKTYYAEHDGAASESDCAAFAEGIELADGTKCLPAKLEILEQGKCLVSVQEGKYHQVRRMLASRGLPVTYLKRLSVGGLTLGDLPLGKIRELSAEEVLRKTGLL